MKLFLLVLASGFISFSCSKQNESETASGYYGADAASSQWLRLDFSGGLTFYGGDQSSPRNVNIRSGYLSSDSMQLSLSLDDGKSFNVGLRSNGVNSFEGGTRSGTMVYLALNGDQVSNLQINLMSGAYYEAFQGQITSTAQSGQKQGGMLPDDWASGASNTDPNSGQKQGGMLPDDWASGSPSM